MLRDLYKGSNVNTDVRLGLIKYWALLKAVVYFTI